MKNEYDVVIIGSGVGGLVCGCYLAKSGFNVLILEKNSNVGGCCTSFSRKDQIFDAFAHSVGSLREKGDLNIVLKELGILNRFKYERHDPSDIIISPNCRISFWADIHRTISELKENFSDEAENIESFFKFILNVEDQKIPFLMRRTLAELLADFFTDNNLKTLLSIAVLGNAGLPPTGISAFIAYKLYKEFIFDGGYYPLGGMQQLSDLLAVRFKEFGGNLILSTAVESVKIDNNRALGVILRNDSFVASKNVVASCDILQFLEKMRVHEKRIPDIQKMKASISMCINYFGTRRNIVEICKEMSSTLWVLSHYDIERMYLEAKSGMVNNLSWFFMHGSPDNRGFSMACLAPFNDKGYWDTEKMFWKEFFQKKIGEFSPRIENEIDFSVMTTPQAINKWTSNSCGAVYGWESTQQQLFVPQLANRFPIERFYIAGHWATQGFGISGVSSIGRTIAMRLINKNRNII